LVWVDVFPALRFFEKVELWQVTAMVEKTVGSGEAAHPESVPMQVPVTVANLMLALLGAGHDQARPFHLLEHRVAGIVAMPGIGADDVGKPTGTVRTDATAELHVFGGWHLSCRDSSSPAAVVQRRCRETWPAVAAITKGG
jgi:hypothetical protein